MEYVCNPLSILAHLKVQQVAIVGNLPQRTRSFDRAVEVMKQRLDPK
jgi:hypothetical protein